MVGASGEQEACFVGGHFARVIEFTLRQPHQWMPPEQGAGELSEAAPRRIESGDMRQFVRKRRVLLLGRKCLGETLWQDNHWPPHAKREWRDSTRAGQQCDGKGGGGRGGGLVFFLFLFFFFFFFGVDLV